MILECEANAANGPQPDCYDLNTKGAKWQKSVSNEFHSKQEKEKGQKKRIS